MNPRLRKSLQVVVALIALLLVGVVTVDRSQAAFSDTTSNTTNSFNAGTVVLTDDDAATALFTASGMSPGSPVVECIELTYSGSITPADIRMYGTDTGVLSQYLDLTIEVGTGGTFGDCTLFAPATTIYTGTLDNFTATHTAWATGLATFTAAANPTLQVLRFTVDVQDNNAAQGQSATAGFTWEAQG